MQAKSPSELPKPSKEAQALSDQLQAIIKKAIVDRGGHLSFLSYMQMALYYPNLGYYCNGLQKFGKEGDFVTAPEMSSLFARCLASQFAEILETLSNGSILEFGAGSGLFAADVMLALEKLRQLPERYFILEVSAELQERQRETLLDRCPHLYDRFSWLDGLPDEPIKGIVFVNEVLDAMPVVRVTIRQNRFFERRVRLDGEGNFEEISFPVKDEGMLITLHEQIPPALTKRSPEAKEYLTEVNPQLKPWIASLDDCLSEGVAIIIDYGYPSYEYYHADRFEGSLKCHYRHHVHFDPFQYIGLQDITTNVDFTAVVESALRIGFKLAGYTHLAGFLMGLDFMKHLKSEDDRNVAKRLTSPNEMGEAFKVLTLSKQYYKPLMGHRFLDLRKKIGLWPT